MKIIVIGAGPGGCSAALSAARQGAQVTLVERERLGGACLNRGCIPACVLERSRRLLEEAENAAGSGVHVGRVSWSLEEILRREEMLAGMLAHGVQYLLRDGGVELLRGSASLADARHVRVQNGKNIRELEGDAVILATGSRSRRAPFPAEGGVPVVEAEHILRLEAFPQRILIVGGGPSGVELAAVCHSFGSQVTLVEKEGSLLPGMDSEITHFLRWELEKQAVEICLSSQVERVSGNLAYGRAVIRGPEAERQERPVDMVLLAAGREAVTDGLELERVGLKLRDGFLPVDAYLETSRKGIYAIGDAAGGSGLAHVAARQGEQLGEQLARGERKNLRIPESQIPRCVFSLLEVAAVGLSEQEAAQRGLPISVGRYPFSSNGKALAAGLNGFTKVVIHRDSQEILGVHVVGREASSLIGEAALAVGHRMKVADVAGILYPYPSLCETFREACLSAAGQAFHVTNLSGRSFGSLGREEA